MYGFNKCKQNQISSFHLKTVGIFFKRKVIACILPPLWVMKMKLNVLRATIGYIRVKNKIQHKI